ncbi:DNA gyrase subunit A [Deltaproteobacteria bacterium TL4]
MTETIIDIDIVDEMRDSYMEYAMSVIVGRALPDVRDGLKPVHRRVLYAMHEQNIEYNKPYRKSARVVGDVIGKYHPHGDVAVYDTMVRLTQDFSMRYPLIDGQGNFGSVDGDSPAAMRYTEVRMQKVTREILVDLDKDTVDFIPNYDDSVEEPTVLPTRIPNLLVNGSTGIAVGMSSNIPPHNLKEVMEAFLYFIDHRHDVTLPELMEFIPGPDFPTGGTIVGHYGIYSAYSTGRGIIKVRAKTHVEKEKNDRECIIVTELPYMVNKAMLIEKIAGLVREKNIEGISELRDESDRKGMRIYIQVKKNENPSVVLSNLYKHTAMQSSFGIIMLAIVDNQPKILPLRNVLELFLKHRIEVITRRTRFELSQAQAKAHILEGLAIALDNLDAVITLIREAENGNEAQQHLMDQYVLSKLQAQAILDMKLQRLTGLEQDKIKTDYDQILKAIARYHEILENEELVLGIIREESQLILDQYSDGRRTEIIEGDSSISVEELIKEEDMVITVSHTGYIKRSPVTEYRTQRRGGRGKMGMSTKDEDFVEEMFVSSTHDYMLFFTNLGQIFCKKVYQLPLAGPNTRGKAIINLLPLRPDEKVRTYLTIPQDVQNQLIFMCTANGICKKIDQLDCAHIRANGIRGITLDEGDSLISAQITSGDNEIIFATRKGLNLHIHESVVRTMGRTARGVKGIRLKGDDKVVSAVVIRKIGSLLTVTENGYGKRTEIKDYPLAKHRGNYGVKNINTTKKTGLVVGSLEVEDGYQLFIITQTGKLIRIPIHNISIIGRVTQGNRLIRLDEDERVIAFSPVLEEDSEEGIAGNTGVPGEAVTVESDGSVDESSDEMSDDEMSDDESSDDESSDDESSDDESSDDESSDDENSDSVSDMEPDSEEE